MRVDQAIDVKIGDHLFNPFLEHVVVTNIYKDHGIIVFTVIDTKLKTVLYSYENVYTLDLSSDNICDEERSFIHWAKENREFILDQLENFDTIKQSYMQGYSMGFSDKSKYSYAEQMQK